MSGFARIKRPERRLAERASARAVEGRDVESAGRDALFSVTRPLPPAALFIASECSGCGQRCPLDAVTLVRAALLLVLVAPWRPDPVFARCPACRRRCWLRLVPA